MTITQPFNNEHLLEAKHQHKQKNLYIIQGRVFLHLAYRISNPPKPHKRHLTLLPLPSDSLVHLLDTSDIPSGKQQQ